MDIICNCKRKLALRATLDWDTLSRKISLSWLDQTDKHDIVKKQIRCFSVQHARTYCWRSSHSGTSASSAGHAPTFIALRPSLRIKCTSRGRKSTTFSVVLRLLKTPMLHPYNVLTCVIAAASAPTSWRFKSGRVMNRPPSFIAVPSVAISGKTTELDTTATAFHSCSDPSSSVRLRMWWLILAIWTSGWGKPSLLLTPLAQLFKTLISTRAHSLSIFSAPIFKP